MMSNPGMDVVRTTQEQLSANPGMDGVRTTQEQLSAHPLVEALNAPKLIKSAQADLKVLKLVKKRCRCVANFCR